jgi:hypothetical protein
MDIEFNLIANLVLALIIYYLVHLIHVDMEEIVSIDRQLMKKS